MAPPFVFYVGTGLLLCLCLKKNMSSGIRNGRAAIAQMKQLLNKGLKLGAKDFDRNTLHDRP